MSHCRSCSGPLQEVINLGSLRLNEFRSDDILPPEFLLALNLCGNCSLVQLGQSVDPNLIFTDDYGFESGINNTVRADLAEIVESAIELTSLHAGEVVVDIGCNDGTLLSNYDGDTTIRIGFDPVKKFEEKSSLHSDFIVTDFFSGDVFQSLTKKKARIVTSISMFYDLEDPNKFCHDVYNILHDQGVWVVQQNYLGAMLEQNAYDNIVHQHIEYYSLIAMDYLLYKHGFRIFKVEQNNINGGSFRTFICKDQADYVTDVSVDMLFDREKLLHLNEPSIYYDFASRIKNHANTLHDFLKKLYRSGKLTYIYGASTRGDTLLQYSQLAKRLLPCAVERNPAKVGKKISSLQIPIISEEEAREIKPDYMLVLPWFFLEEFKIREIDYMKNGGRFIIPLPEVGVIGYGDPPPGSAREL